MCRFFNHSFQNGLLFLFCRWVRAVEEFLDVLHASPYMHVQKKVNFILVILNLLA
jgi:hypothetical protein